MQVYIAFCAYINMYICPRMSDEKRLVFSEALYVVEARLADTESSQGLVR
jgi:hypothetical protein